MLVEVSESVCFHAGMSQRLLVLKFACKVTYHLT